MHCAPFTSSTVWILPLSRAPTRPPLTEDFEPGSQCLRKPLATRNARLASHSFLVLATLLAWEAGPAVSYMQCGGICVPPDDTLTPPAAPSAQGHLVGTFSTRTFHMGAMRNSLLPAPSKCLLGTYFAV